MVSRLQHAADSVKGQPDMELNSLSVAVFGIHLEICAEAELLDRVSRKLPPACRRSSSRLPDRRYRFARVRHDGHVQWELRANGLLLEGAADPDSLCERFESDLELYLAVRARTHAIAHAGVVGWRGRAIVIPGRSFSGKTSLTAELIRQGAEYYSDEYAAIDPSGLVHPFPKPLAIRHEHGRTHRTPSELGASTGRSGLPVGLIVVTEYQPGAEWEPQEMSKGRAVLSLLANAAAARHQPAFLLRTFRESVRKAVTLSGPRGDARLVASRLLQMWG